MLVRLQQLVLQGIEGTASDQLLGNGEGHSGPGRAIR